MFSPPRQSLWQHRDFLRLWSGQTISVFGSLISATALPFTAILTLDASPMQVALLSAADLLPGFLVGLYAGVWVDRLRRRPLLIAADIGRALLLLTIPAAAVFGTLHIEHLFVVALLAGALTAVFDIAYQSYLPTLVSKDHIVEANSKLAASASAAEVGAFGLGGWLVQWLTGPIAVFVDAVSFLVSALFLRAIRSPEPEPKPAEARTGAWQEIREGLTAVREHPVLRALAANNLLYGFAWRVFGAVYILYVTRELGFEPGVLGMVWAVGGIVSLTSAALAQRVIDVLRVVPAMVVGLALVGVGDLFLFLASGPTVLSIVFMLGHQAFADSAATVYQIGEVSLRQTHAPPELIGRVNATNNFLALGAQMTGMLVGGLLAETYGLRATLLFSTTLLLPAIVPLLFIWHARAVQVAEA